MGHGVVIPGVDPPSSILGGEAFLARIYDVYRGMRSDTGSNVWNTTLLIGWDEPGGTYDHVPPPAVPPPTRRPRPASWASRSIARAIESRPSSCRRGSPRARCSTRSTATRRSSRRFANNGTSATRSPDATPPPGRSPTSSPSTRRETRRTWPLPTPRPVPQYIRDDASLGTTLSVIGVGFLTAMRHYAAQHDLEIDGLPKDPKADLPPDQVVKALRGFLGSFFPLVSGTTPNPVRDITGTG